MFGLLDRLLAPAPDPAPVAWLGGCEYAHRGLHGPGAPENSLSAFAEAISRGMGIECDVQKSADERAMVFHDWERPEQRLKGTASVLRKLVAIAERSKAA